MKRGYYRRKALLDKAFAFKALQANGFTQGEIGKLFNISRQRVNQIINHHKYNARTKLNSHVRAGKIIRPGECEDCGRVCRAQGHHEDYGEPLNVIWLCSTCHGKKHTKH